MIPGQDQGRGQQTLLDDQPCMSWTQLHLYQLLLEKYVKIKRSQKFEKMVKHFLILLFF
jgi:hypothetical protein